MAATQPTLPSGTVSNDLLIAALMKVCGGGNLYFSNGSYTKVEADAVFDGQDHWATEKAAKFYQIAALMEKPGDFKSTATMLKTRDREYEGKRSNEVNINVVGSGELSRNYFESPTFFDTDQIMVMESADGANFVIFSGLNFSFDHKGEIDGLIDGTFHSKWAGPNTTKVYLYKNVVETAA